jgi:hypothetical protein
LAVSFILKKYAFKSKQGGFQGLKPILYPWQKGNAAMRIRRRKQLEHQVQIGLIASNSFWGRCSKPDIALPRRTRIEHLATL